MAGRVPGLVVSQTAGGPSGSTRVILRGSTEMTGNNQPLYVVDGVPLDNTNFGSAGKGKVGTEKTKAVKVAGKKPKGTATGKQVKKKPQQKTASERYMALKTNIAYDAIAVPNLAFEMQFSKHISVELPVMFSGWDISDKHAVRTFAVQPEGRWWLEKAGTGHFFGVHAHMALFNVKWDENRYQSTDRPLLGAGVSYGYKLPFSRHWGAEFTLGAGYANMKYNTYYNIDLSLIHI